MQKPKNNTVSNPFTVFIYFNLLYQRKRSIAGTNENKNTLALSFIEAPIQYNIAQSNPNETPTDSIETAAPKYELSFFNIFKPFFHSLQGRISSEIHLHRNYACIGVFQSPVIRLRRRIQTIINPAQPIVRVPRRVFMFYQFLIPVGFCLMTNP